MAIFVDDGFSYDGKDKWCHMWTDGDDEELDRFAVSIGLRITWAHTSQGAYVGRFYHYDLRQSKRELALKKGAQFMPLKDWIKQRVDQK